MPRTPTARALSLLSLLQTQRMWRGAVLAERLGVTERTVRRDVDRLRELGYPIDATTGPYGGYRLAIGAHVPPLLLDDDEAVAVAVGLRYAAEAAISGMEESSLRALTKLERLLPHRLRRRVSALRSSVSSVPWTPGDPIDPEAIGVLAGACAHHEEVRFGYRRGDGEVGRRTVQPHELVTAGRRWYLVAWDRDRAGWRLFRLDRVRAPAPTGLRFEQRDPPVDARTMVADAVRGSAEQVEVLVRIGAPLAALDEVLAWVDHTAAEDLGDSCAVRLRAPDVPRLALVAARIALSAPVAVVEPSPDPAAPELAAALRRVAAHLADPRTATAHPRTP